MGLFEQGVQSVDNIFLNQKVVLHQLKVAETLEVAENHRTDQCQ
jgi:hypothetical protein